MDEDLRCDDAPTLSDATPPPQEDAPPPEGVPPVDEALTAHVPGPEYWAGLQRRHRQNMLWVVVGLLVTLAMAAGIWVAVTAGTRGAAKVEGVRPGRPTGSGASALPTSAPGGAVPGSSTTTPSLPVTTSPDATTAVRAALVAYRQDGGIWVAGEAGERATRVATSSAGVFALSPNGRKLALIEAGGMKLVMVDVASGKSTVVGPALPVRPSWSPDSSLLAFTRPSTDDRSGVVARVDASARQPSALFPGWRPRFLSDGRSVIAAPDATTGGSQVIALRSDGREVKVAARVRTQEVCPTELGVYFSDAGGLASGAAFTAPSIGYVGFDGRAARSVVATTTAGEHVSFTDLTLSPDGMWLSYAETGDDGYSRVFAVRTAPGARPVALKRHKDAYLLGWSASGEDILLVEGNAVAGERQDVTAIHPDGTGWRVVVSGGGL